MLHTNDVNRHTDGQTNGSLKCACLYFKIFMCNKMESSLRLSDFSKFIFHCIFASLGFTNHSATLQPLADFTHKIKTCLT